MISIDTKRYLRRFDEILNEMEMKMLTAIPVNNITIYFIECMIPHHRAAIYMCENLLKYTDYKPLQDIAKGIIRMQTRGINQMKEIMATTSGYSSTRDELNLYAERYLEITKNMIRRMRNSDRCENINLDFVSEMIPHHEGAIEMCNNLLQYRIDPRLKKVADQIIEEQSRGVKELQEVKKNLCDN